MPSNKGTKWKSTGALGMSEIYKHYVSECGGTLTRSVFSKVLNDCNKEFIKLIIYKGKTMRMPYIGTLEIIKRMSRRTPKTDFKKFLDTGEITPYDNSHSDGYIARFRWDKYHLPIPGRSAYCFEPARDNARALTQELKKFNGHAKYIEPKPRRHGK